MAGEKKFGFFSGVFTPSILTILGVIMYMRLGWVVGHSGLLGAVTIILIAHVISVATGLSISSIATNKEVGAGGVYYVLSRSLGLPMGGAIGFTLFIATSFSIALYLIGFAENFNPVLGMGSSINDFRVSGTLALLLLTILVYVSTSVAIKSQYFILAAIVLSLIAVFFGNTDAVTPIVGALKGESEISFGVLFSIFFPAVTGFTAGIAMSGDLKNPKKDIPLGTMLAIGAGLIVYLSLAVFLALNVDETALQTNYNVLMNIAVFAPFVIAGIWGATLSSALGGLLGGPRIFQAMSLDKITPYSKLFAQGSGPSNEPRKALILTIIIAEIGVLVGELDAIARLVSMFYLMAYNFINLSFFLESWANSDFSPRFKVNKWVGAVGFLATFTVMFQIDPIAMVVAYILLFGLYFFLKRKEMSLQTGDIWGSVWSSVVKTGLKKMDEMEEHSNYWRPNILLFSGGTEKRPHLIEISKDLGGRTGMISNFDLIESPEANVLFPKRDKGIKTTDILEEGVFLRKQEVKDIYSGIETIASVYGFSGIEPNTVLMGWPRKTNTPGQFAQLTQSLIDLDYNVLYLDYDEARGFGKYQTIDLWWRGISNNVILTIKLVKFLLSSPRWANAKVRVILVNEEPISRDRIQANIHAILKEFRLSADIKLINNTTEKLGIFSLMKTYSSHTDLVFIGVPEKIYDETTYVSNTNNLLDNIGTTLMVRASSQFEEIKLGFKSPELKVSTVEVEHFPELHLPFNAELNLFFSRFEEKLFQVNQAFIQNAIATLVANQSKIFEQYLIAFNQFFEAIEFKKSQDNFKKNVEILNKHLLEATHQYSTTYHNQMARLVDVEVHQWVHKRSNLFAAVPEVGKRELNPQELVAAPQDSIDVKWIKFIKSVENRVFGKAKIKVDLNALAQYYHLTVGVQNSVKLLHDFGMIKALNIKSLRDNTIRVVEELLSASLLEPEKRTALVLEAKKRVVNGLKSQTELNAQKPKQLLHLANRRDREMLVKMVELTARLDVNDIIEDLEDNMDRSKVVELKKEISSYPQFWERNQELFTNVFTTWVTITGLQVELLFMKERASREVKGRLFGLFKRYIKKLASVNDPNDNLKAPALDLEELELLHYSPTEMLGRIQDKLRDHIRHIPEVVDIINEESMLNFEDFQGEEVSQISIDLQKIADYYLEVEFIEPLNRSVSHTFHTLTVKLEDFEKRVAFISEVAHKPEKNVGDQVADLTQRFQTDLKELELELEAEEARFMELLNKLYTELSSKLSLSELQKTSTNPARFVHIKRGYKGFFDKWTLNWSKIQKLGENAIFSLKIKQHQLRIAEFNDRNKTLVNKRKVFRDFTDAQGVSEKKKGVIPSYYRHLFSGKQVINSESSVQLENELNQICQTLQSNLNGAVMVISEPLAGKSYFLEKVIAKLSPPQVLRINPPKQGYLKGVSIEKAIQEAYGEVWELNKILNALPKNAVVLIPKMEQWWKRTSGGAALINKWTELIDKHGHRIHFVISMNIHSYELIRQVTGLESVLGATVIIPPTNRSELAKLMLDRHLISGVDVYNVHAESAPISERGLLKLFEQYAQISKGNIGVTMLRWLASIERFENDKIYISPKRDFKLPSLLPNHWANLLTQVVLHQVMHRDTIYQIFRMQDRKVVAKVIKDLVLTGLLVEISKNTYSIDQFVVKSVLEQLQSEKYLNTYE